MKVRPVLLFLLILTLAACRLAPQPTPEGGAGSSTPAQPSPENETELSTPIQPAPGTSPLPAPRADSLSPLPTPPAGPLAAAVTYLAAELGVSSEEVTVLSSEPVGWPDTSLGCPQPGMMYAQVITPGYRFLLQVEGKEYEVHTDQTGQSVVLCQPASGGLSDPQAAFQILLAHLIQTYPGFGLGQQRGWVKLD